MRRSQATRPRRSRTQSRIQNPNQNQNLNQDLNQDLKQAQNHGLSRVPNRSPRLSQHRCRVRKNQNQDLNQNQTQSRARSQKNKNLWRMKKHPRMTASTIAMTRLPLPNACQSKHAVVAWVRSGLE
ncbi:hypothetical protein AZH44_03135 [Corynebacterium striatum]|nr:hypothetical protein AZH44_03135 [Corynebacterium striatum]